jgi:hypothetical protein
MTYFAKSIDTLEGAAKDAPCHGCCDYRSEGAECVGRSREGEIRVSRKLFGHLICASSANTEPSSLQLWVKLKEAPTMNSNNLDLLRNMSDQQLQEVLSAISTAASQAQAAATPQRKVGSTQGAYAS